MRLLKVIGILLVASLLGLVSGFIVGILLLPRDPTGRGAPGDGILVMFCLGIGLFVSIAASVPLAIRSWRRPYRFKTQPKPNEVPS